MLPSSTDLQAGRHGLHFQTHERHDGVAEGERRIIEGQ